MKTSKICFLILSLFIFQIGKGQVTLTIWHPISEPGGNLIIVNENIGYTYINETASSHGSLYTLKKSTDGFLNFTKIKEAFGTLGCYYLNGMYFCNADTGFISEYCSSARIMKTTDGGQNWTYTSFGGSQNISMYFLNADFGYYSHHPTGYYLSFLSLNDTTVFETSNYLFGNNDSSYPLFKSKMKFINDSTGFIICKDSLYNAVIIKTIDYGYNWSEVKSLSNSQFNDISFVSDSVGFVVGNNGCILKTSNYGENWQSINSNSTLNLNSIDFGNENSGCIVGENGLVLRTQDQGNSWIQESFPDTNDLIYVRCFDYGHTYINNANGKLYSNFVYSANPNNALIYPNPFVDNISISIPSDIQITKINLFNLQGNLLSTSTTLILNTNYISQGIYILEIETTKGVFRNKVVKL